MLMNKDYEPSAAEGSQDTLKSNEEFGRKGSFAWWPIKDSSLESSRFIFYSFLINPNRFPPACVRKYYPFPSQPDI